MPVKAGEGLRGGRCDAGKTGCPSSKAGPWVQSELPQIKNMGGGRVLSFFKATPRRRNAAGTVTHQ